ncbi:MAG TPA: toll/interleukin-1 receptor domain-containing protein, partial [Gammaproteobacteria bacterium]|nr:toll/interleukin-1 receptor domain-containing protein [Gammaproteobacteria bacterium]
MEPQPSQNHHQPVQDYLAFISYRHADNTEEDRQWATWLHQQLEVYDIPADLIGATNLRGERIPERIYPVFRDEISLPADADLSNAVTQALDRSRFLIVLCSPRAVQSHYVNQEILHFKQSGKEERIIAAMICGEPNASVDDAKQENPEDICTQECFPEALQYELGSDGTLDTRKRTEPIAADFRLPDGSEGATNPNTYKRQLLQDGHNKADAERLAQRYEEQLNNAKLKIIAGILGVRLEQLTQRDKFYQLGKARAAARRFRRIAVSMGGLALAATIAGGLAYQQWQRAAEERDRADSLLAQVRKNLDFINYGLRDVMKAYVPTEKRIPLMQLVDGIVEILQQT